MPLSEGEKGPPTHGAGDLVVLSGHSRSSTGTVPLPGQLGFTGWGFSTPGLNPRFAIACQGLRLAGEETQWERKKSL